MRKTLLLVFIHGFKGGDDTFAGFPEHLRALVSHAFPNLDVVALAYPRFETRGELKDCVSRFREWLQNKVIDIEVAHSTPSPTIDPSVHTILVGHSMGGIVAAETFLLLASEQPIPAASSPVNPETPNYPSNTTHHSSTSNSHPNPPTAEQPHPESPSFMFPHIQGILAFDTPFLGLAPGMVAHGLEGGHKMASSAYNTYSEVASIFGIGTKVDSDVTTAATVPRAALPAPTVDAAATPRWQSWGKYAMFAGAAGAVAAGGAAALYSQREKLSAGWGWASSHLLFVGDLVRAENLRKRVDSLEKSCHERSVGCANFYTNLGRGAREGYGITATVAGKERTFCNLPNKVRTTEDGNRQEIANAHEERRDVQGMKWMKAINDKAKDETTAHMMMFTPKDNPGFYSLGEKAKEAISEWVDMGWYSTSEKSSTQDLDVGNRALQDLPIDEDGWERPDPDKETGLGKDWEGLDGARDVDDDVRMRDEDKENMDLDGEMEGSVIVDKAANGEIPLPPKLET